MKSTKLLSKSVCAALCALIFLFGIFGCKIADRPRHERIDKIIGFERDAHLRPFGELSLDTQGYAGVDKIKGVPQELAIAQGTVIVSREAEPPPMIDLRFAKGGLETQFTKQLRLDLFVDAAYLFGYDLEGDIKTNYDAAPTDLIYERTGDTTPGYTTGYSPAVIIGYNAELLYFFNEDSPVYMMLGGRYREYNLRVLQGGWHWGLGDDTFGDNMEFEADKKTTVANIYEKSVYLGIGAGARINEDKSNEHPVWFNVALKIGLAFNDVRVKDSWKNYLSTDYDYPAVFGGLDIGFRF